MSELKRFREAEEYSDRDRDQETFSLPEETYRDGSIKNECWDSGDALPAEESDEQRDEPVSF